MRWFQSTRQQARTCCKQATACLDVGDDDLALSWFNEAIRLDGRLAFGYLGRGFVLLRQGHYERAIGDFSEAIRLASDARAYFLRGLCYEARGDLGRQRADQGMALSLDPAVEKSLTR
jgi:tetratricopeptide (TPR) repeat protein